MKKRKFSLNTIFAGMSSLCVMASALPIGSAIPAAAESDVYGDANLDGQLSISDAVMIMSHASNPDKTPLINEDICDVYNRGDGVDSMDSLSVQKRLTNIVSELPESYMGEQKPDENSDAAYIHLQNTSISVEGDNAEVNGTTVTITASGEYYIDGTLENGQIAVNVPDETVDAETVKIFLNGVNITGASAPAIYVNNAENTSINLVEGTTNTVSDGTVAYADDYLDNAVIHAKDDITIKGNGILEVTAHTQNAVHCNNDLKINGGTINIITETGDALRGKTSVTVKDGNINIDSAGDGIKSTKGNVSITGGTVAVKAGNDAVQAETSIDISGGNITASGDRGLTSVTGVNITGGTVTATATDNQAELVTSTQGTMLLNCIDDASNTDGCWKKSNSIAVSDSVTASPLKKFKYVLISDASIKSGSSYTLTNTGTSTAVTHTNDSSTAFDMNSEVTTFEAVNLASSSTSETPAASSYTITLSGADILTNAPEDTAVSANGAVTITKPGIFEVSGTGSQVQIIVDVDKTTYPEGLVELDLMGADITNTSTSPIYVAQIGDECQIVAKKGYTNTITDGTSYTNADGKMGAIYSCDDLKIKGTGTLTVNGNGEDAIVSKNDIKIYNGTIIVNSADDGIRGKDSVTIGNDTDIDFSSLNITVNSKNGDGIKSTETDTTTGKGFITINGGTMDITAYSDGFHASQLLNVNNGDIKITTTCPATASSGGSQGGWGGPGGGMGGPGESSSTSTEVSAKGLKAGCTDDTTNTTIEGTINIVGGNMNITTTDDSIHATDINISGGDITASSGDDGVHADDVLTITNGSINITESYEGLEAADIEVKGGNIHVVSSDDGFNAAGGTDGSGNNNQGGWGGGSFSSSTGTLNISGGYMFVRAEGDGVDSNGDLTISGGTVIVCGPTSGGNGMFDKGDGNYTLNFTGGTIFAIGTSDMMETPTYSGGTYLMANNNVNASTGSIISAADSNGNVIAALKVPDDINSAQAIQFYSSNADSSIGLYSGGTYSGTLNEDGYGEGGTISGASSINTSSSGNTGGWGGRSAFRF